MRMTITAKHVEDAVKRLKTGKMSFPISGLSQAQIDALMARKEIQREIQERASRIHALNAVLARAWWREGWHGGFW